MHLHHDALLERRRRGCGEGGDLGPPCDHHNMATMSAHCVQIAGEDVVEAAGKMGVLDRLLARLAARGHRVVLFSQSNRMLDVIEDFLILRGYTCEPQYTQRIITQPKRCAFVGCSSTLDGKCMWGTRFQLSESALAADHMQHALDFSLILRRHMPGA